MRSKFYITPQAENDLTHQFHWYLRKADEVIAERFLQEFRTTLVRLEKQPHLGRLSRFRSGTLKGIRSVAVSRAFSSHLIFYRIDEMQMVVFRVMHGARDLERRLVDPGS